MNIPLTRFAAAERAPIDVLRRQADTWDGLPFAAALLNAVPDGVVVVNEHRQIVFASQSFRELTTQAHRNNLCGARPGEALGCIHACDEVAGCGTAEFCSQCGAVQAMLEGLQGRRAVRECRMLRMDDTSLEALDLRVLATPFEYGGERFCVFAVADISHEKRRRVLERAFFHDLLNTAGGLGGLMEELTREAPDDFRPDLEVANQGFRDMVDQIEAQRALSHAETNELKTERVTLRSRPLLEELAAIHRNQPLAQERPLQVDPATVNLEFVSDRALLARVLTNLIKNALEASPAGEVVRMGCDETSGGLCFWVSNAGVIPRPLQLQIFHRSFSTKGPGRGLGTYAVKLLTEKYLGGTATFASSAEAETTFRIALPLDPEHTASRPTPLDDGDGPRG